MRGGWVSIHRKLVNSAIYRDSEAVHLWVHLLILANHDDNQFVFCGKPVVVKRGQVITGRKSLSAATGISESKIQRILKTLEDCHMIEQQSSNKNRLITITKYDEYQQGEQQTNNKKVPKVDSAHVKLMELFPELSEQTAKDYIAIRKAKKSPLTETAVTGIVREAGKANLKPHEAILLCCERGWVGFKAEWLTRDSKPVYNNDWVKTHQGIDAKAKELGVNISRCANYKEATDMIFTKLKGGK